MIALHKKRDNEHFSRAVSVLKFMTDDCFLFQVLPDWNEYEDSFGSGRKFYYNTVTKEKSWKPPWKPKGSSDGEKTNRVKY